VVDHEYRGSDLLLGEHRDDIFWPMSLGINETSSSSSSSSFYLPTFRTVQIVFGHNEVDAGAIEPVWQQRFGHLEAPAIRIPTVIDLHHLSPQSSMTFLHHLIHSTSYE